MSLSVTAVVPVFNNRDMIADAITSIRNQSRHVDELLVVDDGSTDGSDAIAAALGARVIRLPSNQGPAAARNAAIKAATSDVVAFLDADDMWLPEHCSRLLGALDRHPDAALVTSRSQSALPLHSSLVLRQAFDALPHLVRDNCVIQSAVMVRRDTLLEVGGYDEQLRYSEDYALWLKLALRHSFIILPDVTVMRRDHERQVTWENMRPLYETSWRLRLDLLKDLHIIEEPARREHVVLAMRDALDVDFDRTWRALDALSFRAIEVAAAKVPGAAQVRRHWRHKRLVGWHAWGVMARLHRGIRALVAQANQLRTG